ncbi:MAG: GNAT family N-acetyltransferase [Vitreoscilla sp.]|nr:GNAT family N-acetyltransferase [Vitreoscilla sp.]
MHTVQCLLEALRAERRERRPAPAAPRPPAPPAEERLALPRGRAVLLRPIRPQDAEAEQAFVSGLSLASRHKRFHVGLRQLSPAMLHQMTVVDPAQHVALVAEALTPEPDAAPRLVADARYVHLAGQPGEAEFALAVADDWQSLGLGRTLIDRLARRARHQGLRALVGDVLPENRRMLVLMRGLGAHTRPHPDGPSLVQVVFPL